MELIIKDVSTNRVLVSLGNVDFVPGINETIEVLGPVGVVRSKVYRVHTEYRYHDGEWSEVYEIHVGSV